MQLRSAAGRARWLASAVATAVAIVTLALFAIGLEAGAAAAGSESIWLESPLYQVARVDELLLGWPPVSIVDRAIAWAWPVIEAPILAGVEIGLSVPLFGHVVFYGGVLALFGLAAMTAVGVTARPIGRWIHGGDDGA